MIIAAVYSRTKTMELYWESPAASSLGQRNPGVEWEYLVSPWNVVETESFSRSKKSIVSFKFPESYIRHKIDFVFAPPSVRMCV